MTKYFDFKKQRRVVKLNDKFGNLTVCSEAYTKHKLGDGKHRRQHVDCKCDCGNIREYINSKYLKSGSISYACNSECIYWPKVLNKNVPESDKIAKIGDTYGYFTVIEDAFYYKKPGEPSRSRCIKVKCICGRIRTHKEGKIINGFIKSCGCKKDGTSFDTIKYKSNRVRQLKKYNMTIEDYELLLKEQNGCCAICKTDKPSKSNSMNYFPIDHCHITGKIRGLLCNNCNRAIGMLQDDINIIQNALNYLNKNN
jgi:hypothetical protein